jgi:hypothetical protein
MKQKDIQNVYPISRYVFVIIIEIIIFLLTFKYKFPNFLHIQLTTFSFLFFVLADEWKERRHAMHVGPIYLRYIKTRIFSSWRIGFLFFAPCRVYRWNVMNEHCQTVWVAVGSECHIVVATARIQLFIVNIHGILQLQIIRSWHLNWGVLHLQFRVVMFDITMVWSVTHETRNLINIEYEHHETT